MSKIWSFCFTVVIFISYKNVVAYTHLDTVFNYGYKAYNNKDYINATKLFDSCIKLNPKSDDCLYMRAMIAMDLGDFKLAKRLLQASASIRNNQLSTWVQLGICHTDLKEFDSAEMCFQRAVRINSRVGTVYANWARNEFMRNDLEHAEELFNTALLMDDNNADYIINRAKIRKLRGKDAEAKADIELAKNINPNNKNLAEVAGLVQTAWYLQPSTWGFFGGFLVLYLGIIIYRKKKYGIENN